MVAFLNFASTWEMLSLNIWPALSRARFAIVSVATVYFLSCLLGAILVHGGNHFALHNRDSVVGAAQTSTILTQLSAGHPLRAAILDFGGNLVGGISSGLLGLFPPMGYGMALFRGWIGGIVSVNGEHQTRLASARSGIYYVGVLLLQIIPYSLVGGAGINIGISLYRCPAHYSGARWWSFPLEALRDGWRLLVLAIPLFLIASLIEFYFA